MYSNSKTKKVFVAILSIAMIFGVLADFGGLQTANAQTTTVVGSGQFTRNLTIGSQGSDVSALQTFLEGRGFLTIPAGVAKGYFGPLTRAALARYQASVGISPAVGYFGPITRNHLNGIVSGGGTPIPCPAGFICTPVTTTIPCPAGFICTPISPTASPTTSPGTGREGRLQDIEEISALSSEEVIEGREDVQVLGFQYEARDSDITIERIDVDLTPGQDTSVTGESSNLSRYIESVSLWNDGDKIAEQDVDEADESGDVFSFRFTGLNIRTDEGDTEQIYIAVTPVTNIDTANQGANVTIEIPQNGLRAVDEAGLSETYVSDGEITSTFTVESLSTAGDLDLRVALSGNDDINRSHIVTVNTTSDTNNVPLLSFTLRARGSEITVEEIPVLLTATGAENVDDIVNRIELYRVSGTRETLIDSKNIPSTSGSTEVITFDDLGLVIDADSTEEFVVRGDINGLNSALDEGDTLKAEITSTQVDLIEAEDENEDTLSATNLTGSASAQEVAFFQTGISAELRSSSATRTNGTVAGDPDRVEFRIRFGITATGDEDVYVDGDTVLTTSPGVETDGLAWAPTSDTTVDPITAQGIVTPDNGYTANDVNNAGDKRFLIRSGETRNFTFTVSIPATTDNTAVGVRITGLKWDTVNQDVMNNVYTFDLGSFSTDVITGLFVR